MNLNKLVAKLILIAGFTCFALLIYLDGYYDYMGPYKPQPEVGRIYPHHIHITIVYLTKQEDLQLRYLFWGGMSLIMTIFVYDYFFNPFKDEKKDWENWKRTKEAKDSWKKWK